MATGLLPTVNPGGCWRCCCFFCCWWFCFLSYFFFFTIGVHWIFVLMHCEARERFSRPMRSGVCAVAGIVNGWLLYSRGGKNAHIYEICVECRWKTSPEMHAISQYWRRRKRIGRWRGSINWGQELRTIRFYLPVVLEKCFVIRGWDVGGVLGVQ